MKRQALKGAIVSKYGSCEAFAAVLGVSRQTVSNAVCGRSTPRDILQWCDALDIDPAEAFVFFTRDPQKTKEIG